MRKNLIYLLLPFLAFAIASCSNDLDPLEAGNHRSLKKKTTSKKYTMKLSLGGDFITESEEPLFRADESLAGDYYVGVNVTRTSKTDTNPKEEKYAYGVFKYAKEDFTRSISIDLYNGYTYNFEATILREWTDKMQVSDGSNPSVKEPFRVNNSGDFDSKPFELSNEGEFTYNEIVKTSEYLSCINKGTAYVKVGADWDQDGAFSYPRVKRYYGKLDNFDPETTVTENNMSGNTRESETDNTDDNSSNTSVKSAEIQMYYQCFGLQMNVTLPEGTSLTVEDVTKKNGIADKDVPEKLLFPNDLVFNSSKPSWEGLFSMNTMAVLSEGSRVPEEEFTLKFTWNRADSHKETFTQNVTVHTKKKKIINVNVTGSANTKGGGNIIFSELDDVLIDDDVTSISKKYN